MNIEIDDISLEIESNIEYCTQLSDRRCTPENCCLRVENSAIE